MNLTYEIVELPEKKLVGHTGRTSNSAPDMGSLIGGMWQRLFAEGLYFSIPAPADDRSIGLYSGYESDMTGGYDVTIGRAVTEFGVLPDAMVKKTIPAGRYAAFVVHGDAQEAVGQFWQAVWQLPLDRAYTFDYEEYLPSAEGEEPEIRVYLALK